MALDAKSRPRATVEAVVIRKDGTREELGVIASTDDNHGKIKRIPMAEYLKRMVKGNG